MNLHPAWWQRAVSGESPSTFFAVHHVQAFLGHASLDSTKIYLRLVPGRLKADYERAMPEIAVGLSE